MDHPRRCLKDRNYQNDVDSKCGQLKKFQKRKILTTRLETGSVIFESNGLFSLVKEISRQPNIDSVV